MIKFAVLLLSLTLLACTGTADLRPDVYIKAESLLQHGVEAYKNDAYQQAIQHFKQAIELYQSIDDERGIQLARFNLANSALAQSKFSEAKTQIDLLKKQNSKSLLSEHLSQRLIFLESKYYFAKQDYAAAFAMIKPLTVQTDKQSKPSLNLLAMLARLEVLNSAAKKTVWLEKFQTALLTTEANDEKQQVILKRILGYIALKKSDYRQAEQLFNQALSYYKEQANRRGIADCLERLAEIELERKNFQQAAERLDKALKIRQWLKDDYKTEKIRQQLAELSKN